MAKKKPKKTAKTDEELGDDAEEDAGGGSKLKLIGGAVVLMILGMFVGPKLMGAEAAPVDPNAPTTTTTAPRGDVYMLEARTLNLADGRILRVGIAIEVGHDADYPSIAPDPDDPTLAFIREVDAAISILSSFTFDQLAAPGGKDEAREIVLAEFRAISEDQITDLYWYDFVWQ